MSHNSHPCPIAVTCTETHTTPPTTCYRPPLDPWLPTQVAAR